MGAFSPSHGLPVLLRPDNDELPFELAQPVTYRNTITELTIPAGFALDFASVPRPLWWLFPRVGRYARAALVHDVLYRKGDVDRSQADALFLTIMRQDNVPRWQRWPMYWAVRCFGWAPWRTLRRVEQDPDYHWQDPKPTGREPGGARSLWVGLVLLVLLLLASAARGQCVGGYCLPPPGGWGSQRQAAPQQTAPPAVKQAFASVVRIHHAEQGGASLGSGVVFHHAEGRSYVLTCAHLFTEAGRTTVRLAGSQPAAAKILAIDRPHDLAVLECEPINAPAAPTAEGWRGSLSAVGFGGSGVLRAVTGQVTGQSIASGAQHASVRIRGSVRSGDSGGPVFNSRGEVVGVVWGQRGGESYAMVRTPVRNLLRRVLGRVARPLAPVPRGDASRESGGQANPGSAGASPGSTCRDCDGLRDEWRLWREATDKSLQGVVDEWRDWRESTDQRLDALAAAAPINYVPLDTYEQNREEDRTLLEGLWNRVQSRQAAGEVGWRKHVEGLAAPLLAAFGIGGPVGAGLWLVARAVGRRRRESRGARREYGDAREASPKQPFRAAA